MFCDVLHILCVHVVFSRGSSPLPVVSQAHMKTSHHLIHYMHTSQLLLLKGILALFLSTDWYFQADTEPLNVFTVANALIQIHSYEHLCSSEELVCTYHAVFVENIHIIIFAEQLCSWCLL